MNFKFVESHRMDDVEDMSSTGTLADIPNLPEDVEVPPWDDRISNFKNVYK